MENTIYMERGALWLVLHASRIVGVAPLHFTPLRNGYTISLSRVLALYSYLFTIILGTIFLYSFSCVLEMLKTHTSYHHNNFSLSSVELPNIENFTDIITTISIVSVGCYGVMGRMKHMIQHLNLLEKIKVKLNNIRRLEAPETGLLVNVLGNSVAVVGTLFLYVCCGTGRWSYSVWVYCIVYFIILILQVQLLLIHLEVTTVLKMMNVKMRNLLHSSKTDNTSRTHINDGIRCLIQSYVSICDVTRRMNKSYGVVMFLIFNYHVLMLIRSGYSFTKLYVAIHYEEPHVLKIHILFFLFSAFNIVNYVIPSDDIKNKTLNMRADLCHLMYNVKPLGMPVPTELVLFHKQLILNEPSFTPLGIFTFNRSLVSTIFSGATTYLLLLLRIKGNIEAYKYYIL